ncbi:unnamed protein product [Prorocentrum cordatum]|uniref:Uncharacterized protein n=1 Tax=Prorocentrum cordatum TaxID=2364126 RepID=A0ABN9PCF1_9DINO|nr:unnamed protein product [Polarella glacialis]
MAGTGGRRKTATAAPDLLAIALMTPVVGGCWYLGCDSAPDFSSYPLEWASRPNKEHLKAWDTPRRQLHEIGEGRRFSQTCMEEAWTTAFEDRVKEHIAKKMMEKDPASVGQKRGPKVKMDGHRYLQSRAARKIFTHWQKLNGYLQSPLRSKADEETQDGEPDSKTIDDDDEDICENQKAEIYKAMLEDDSDLEGRLAEHLPVDLLRRRL